MKTFKEFDEETQAANKRALEICMQEFLQSLDSEHYETREDYLKNLIIKVAGYCTSYSNAQLEIYHDWLTKQLPG